MLLDPGRIDSEAIRTMGKRTLQFDEIGYWSEVKLSILNDYAKPYNTILRANKLHPVYVDAFAGAGHHISKNSGQLIKGSPVRALEVNPPFELLHFVDMDESRTEELARLSAGRGNVKIYQGMLMSSCRRVCFLKFNLTSTSVDSASLTPMVWTLIGR